jgi:hypothetical protein
VPRPVRWTVSRLLARADSARTTRRLGALAASGRPILAGPWLGEVGFELLYWAPFLTWFVERFAVEPSRLLVVSRGGTAGWYPAGVRYADVLDLLTPQEYKAQHDARVAALGEQKQTRVTAFERELVARLDAAGAADAGQLHPSAMYHVLRPFWWGHCGPEWVHAHVRYRRLVRPARPSIAGASGSYVAVKFYFNECFPATAANRAFVRRVIAGLAEQGPVVSLSGGLGLDDHDGLEVEGHGVIELSRRAAPAANLTQQSAIVANARAFVGTYGGFAYMAPFYGVPSTAYYSNAGGFAPSHLAMVRSALATVGAPPPFDVRQAD